MASFDPHFDAFNSTHTEEGLDFDAFINYPEEKSESLELADFQFTEMDFDCLATDYSFSNVLDCSPSTVVSDSFSLSPQTYQGIVDNWAHADPRSRSMKQKRRDAAIDLHLQRFTDACPDARNMLDANWVPIYALESYSHSSSLSPQSSQDSFCDLSRTASTYSVPTPVSPPAKSEQPSQPASTGLELVLDINMNATTQLPKKHKKRTKAQIEDYINARRNGACLKHRKQHKKCNCAEKVATGVVSGAKIKKSCEVSGPLSTKPDYSVGVDSFLPLHVHASIQSSPPIEGRQVATSVPVVAESLDPTSACHHVLDQYVCLMPGCTFTSDTVPSLQLHYNAHFRPVQSSTRLSSVVGQQLSVPQALQAANTGQQSLLWSSSHSSNSSVVDVSPEHPVVVPLGENRPIATISRQGERFGSSAPRILAEWQELPRALQIPEGQEIRARMDRGERPVGQQGVRADGLEKHRPRIITHRRSVSVKFASNSGLDFQQLFEVALCAHGTAQLLLAVAHGIWRALQTALATWVCSASFLSRHMSHLILDESRQHSHLGLTQAAGSLYQRRFSCS